MRIYFLILSYIFVINFSLRPSNGVPGRIQDERWNNRKSLHDQFIFPFFIVFIYDVKLT